MKLHPVIVIAFCSAILAGSSPVLAATATASLTMSVTVRPWLKFKAVQHATMYEVTQADLEHGYVDIPNSAEVQLRTNERRPIAILVEHDGPAAIQVAPSGGAFTGSNTLDLGQQKAGVVCVRKLDCRVMLPAGTRVGKYALNVTITPHVY